MNGIPFQMISIEPPKMASNEPNVMGKGRGGAVGGMDGIESGEVTWQAGSMV